MYFLSISIYVYNNKKYTHTVISELTNAIKRPVKKNNKSIIGYFMVRSYKCAV